MELPKGIALMEMSQANVTKVWTEFNRFPKLFMDHQRGDQQHFMQQLLAKNSLYFVLDDAGIIYFTDILPKYIAKFHLMFWDKQLRGREPICKDMIGWAFNTLKVEKVWTSIPAFARVQRKFAERLGFLREGCFRKGYPCMGTNYDVYWYGMLKEDFDGQLSREQQLGVGDIARPDRLREVRETGGPAEPMAHGDEEATGATAEGARVLSRPVARDAGAPGGDGNGEGLDAGAVPGD
jgi:RimJ/RimL family protein N-acetyltransferase